MNNTLIKYITLFILAISISCSTYKLHYKELLINEKPVLICKEIQKEENKSKYIIYYQNSDLEGIIFDTLLFAAELSIDSGYKYIIFINNKSVESDLKNYHAEQFNVEIWNHNNIKKIEEQYKSRGIETKIIVYSAPEILKEMNKKIEENTKGKNIKYK